MDQSLNAKKILSVRHWELAVDSLSDLLLMVDEEMRIIRGNRAIESWGLGVILEVRGLHVHRLLHAECRDEDCPLRQFVDNLKPHERTERRIESEHEDRRLGRWVHLTAEALAHRPFRGDEPGLQKPAFLITVRDTTEIHVQRVRDGRRTRFETHHHLARRLAHEINNPLAAMHTTIEVLTENLDRFDGEKVSAYLGTLLEGTDRLRAIVDRSLSTQRGLVLDLQPTAVDHLFERVRRLFEDQLTRQGLSFKVEKPAPDLEISIDLIAAEEILVNLLRNAADATPAGGSVWMTSRGAASDVAIAVRDDGAGMDAFQLDTVFQPFVSTKPQGLGIGLAYSNHLMSKMSGSIEIDSHVGLGTTVTLFFAKPGSEESNDRDGEARPDPDR